jgi:hypothetical protein
MRSNQLITGVLAAVATSSLIGMGSAAQAGEATTTPEKGIVIECSGTWRGEHVFASLYENNLHGNTIQVVVGDGDAAGDSRSTRRDFVDGRAVRGVLKLDGRRALIEGRAHAVGKKSAVHEEHDDAGQHITVDGTHRRLASKLALTWKGTTVPLDCADSFVYDLQVTKESTVD